MRQQIDIHHEQMMEAERIKDELSRELSFCPPQETAKIMVLRHRLNVVINYGLIAMREIDTVAEQN